MIYNETQEVFYETICTTNLMDVTKAAASKELTQNDYTAFKRDKGHYFYDSSKYKSSQIPSFPVLPANKYGYSAVLKTSNRCL